MGGENVGYWEVENDSFLDGVSYENTFSDYKQEMKKAKAAKQGQRASQVWDL